MEQAKTNQKPTQSILFYSLLLVLLVAISTQLTHKQTHPIHQNNIQNPIQSHPIHSEEYLNSQEQVPFLPPPSQHHPTNHETSQTNHKIQSNKTKIHVSKSINHFFSTQNSFWSISSKVLKTTFRSIVVALYYPLTFLFNLLNIFIRWVWDQIIFPMTFPIRLSCWIFIIKPIQIVKSFLMKLKPLILFVISGITIGVLIGIMGSLVHLFIANRLFPLHLKTKIALNKPLQNIDIPKKKSIHTHNTDDDNDSDHPFVQEYHQDKQDQQSHQREQLNQKKSSNTKMKKSVKEKRAKRKKRKEDEETSSELSTLDEQDLMEEYWSLSGKEEDVGSQISDLKEIKKGGYSSAIQSIINDQSRKRSSSNFNLNLHSTTPSPISNPPLGSHSNHQSSSSPSPSSNPNNKKTCLLSSPTKKKVTFKID